MPSFILIHPTVWPQYTNVTDRTGQTDNCPTAQGEPFYERSPRNDGATDRQDVNLSRQFAYLLIVRAEVVVAVQLEKFDAVAIVLRVGASPGQVRV